MTELGFATLPRGRRLLPVPNGLNHNNNNTNSSSNSNNNNNSHHHKNGHLPNQQHQHQAAPPSAAHVLFQLPTIPLANGGTVVANGGAGGRAVHDGFATIRAGGCKRGRSRSSPSVSGDPQGGSCTHGCCNSGGGGGRGLAMEPLWEEKGESSGAAPVSRRDRSQLPWWEVATRRSRYRSCPAFSQASMVTALEQTMTSVTDRLERLASSPDLKETEAAELRKTAAVLRQQSSAVCQSVSSGYISMERQLSCDSVSSVTSTVSGASLSSYASLGSRSLSATHMPHCNTHNLGHIQSDSLNPPSQAKLKKRSWLRSSFRRAFGRHGRKRGKQQGEGCSPDIPQELPLHHTVNTSVRHLPAPPSNPPSNTLPRKPNSAGLLVRRQQSQKQRSVPEESEVVRQLREEVGEKERALTDSRLEVLSAQHQLQAQADTIARLQAEVVGLREENLRLVSVVRGQKGQAADALLPPLTHTLTTLTISSPTLTRGNSVPHEDGHHMKVVVVGQPRAAATTTTTTTNAATTAITTTTTSALDPALLTHTGNITVGSKTTWEQLDTMIINSLKDYGNRVDPVSALGLDAASLECYQVENVVCGPHLPRPELLPYGYCVGDVDAVQVWLKDASQKKEGEAVGSVSSASFSSVIPASSLRHLAGLLVEHHRLVLAGPPAMGKTFLARTLAQLYVVNSGQELTQEAIKVFKVTGSNSLELCQLLSSMWPRGGASSSLPSSRCASPALNASPRSPLPAIIILDDLHAAGGVVETLQRCLPSTLHVGPAIIATCCPTATLSTRLHIHCNFKWAALSTQQEPVRGLLGRVLRRRVAAAEVAANTRLPDAHHLAEWLTRLWLHLNTVLTGHCGSVEAVLGPGLLVDCPLGQEETQAWFTEVWNTRLVPHITRTLRAAAPPASSLLDTWTDPLDWVLATYPWPINAASGPDQLTRTPASDLIPQEGGGVSRRTVSPHRCYTSFPGQQQVLKPESVYAVPQPLSRASRTCGSDHGSSQSLITTERNAEVCNPGQATPLVNTRHKHLAAQCEGHGGSERDTLDAVRRARSKSAGSQAVMAVNSDIYSARNGSRLVVAAQNMGKSSVLTTNRLSNVSRSHADLSKSERMVLSSVEICDPIDSMSSDKRHLSGSIYGEITKSNNYTEADEKNGNFKVQNNVYGAKTKVNHQNTSSGNFEGDAAEVDGRLNIQDAQSQSLDILAKNAKNNNSLVPECVRIMSSSGSKLGMKNLAQELTSTFKPMESGL